MDEVEAPAYPALGGDRQCDVCVVGAGIAGLTTAYLLAAEGRSVAVIERDGIAAGQRSPRKDDPWLSRDVNRI